nr:hypothetical protein [Tanacetum cinerariifolium]
EDFEALWKMVKEREYFEALWKMVKERFETTKPKNLSDDFLLNILKIMSEKPNVKASTQMILLVEKKYPLTHFTLQQMLDNVRLEVEEENEMSLELLRNMKVNEMLYKRPTKQQNKIKAKEKASEKACKEAEDEAKINADKEVIAKVKAEEEAIKKAA